MGNNSQCTQYCQKTLKVDPKNSQATYMLANLMLMNSQSESAIQTYMKLLEKSPDQFDALAQLIELLRRAGRVKDVPPYLERAELACARSSSAGLAYNKGIYHRFMAEPQLALKELNIARFDSVWGQFALTNMIEIYLNPLNE
jgi:tetratricopeptide repeat protein 21B